LEDYDKRIAELNQFKKIGRSRMSEVLTAQAQQAALKAQLKQIRGQLKAQRAVLVFLTGFDLDVPIHRPNTEGVASKPIEECLSRVDIRPDVRADMARAKAADDGISVARAGHLPTLGLQGDYYLERTGAQKDVNWDVMLNLTVPLFSGGIVQAQVGQAVSKRDQAELQVSRTRRLARQQIQQFFENLTGDREQMEGYREASALSERNYKEELREYRLGLVTNLDVLQALNGFQESKRSFDKARYAMLQDIQSLEAAAAFRPDTSKVEQR
jgi:outer membrane protein TolC